MARLAVALLAGALFGAGLLMSGMTDTRKVQGWLDIFGEWNPTLAFVLAGAILPMTLAWRVAARRRAALLGTALARRLPSGQRTPVQAPLALVGGGCAVALLAGLKTGYPQAVQLQYAVGAVALGALALAAVQRAAGGAR